LGKPHHFRITFIKGDDVILADAAEIKRFSEFAGITDPAIIRKPDRLRRPRLEDIPRAAA
jgi:hypothetical protein